MTQFFFCVVGQLKEASGGESCLSAEDQVVALEAVENEPIAGFRRGKDHKKEQGGSNQDLGKHDESRK